MPKFCMINKLKDEHIQDYSDIHKNCWPEIRQALHDAGAKNCTVFVQNNMSILFYECDDLKESFEKLAENEDYKKWQAVVNPWFDSEGGFSAATTEKVFDLNE